MKFVQIIVLPLILVLTACGKNEAPNCSDKKTTDLVTKIGAQKVYNRGGIGMKLQSIRVDSVRTLNLNKELGSYYCAANLIVDSNVGNMVFPITYTSELIDGGGKFYVTVNMPF